MNRPIFPPLLILATLIAGCPKDSYGGGCTEKLDSSATMNTAERIPVNENTLAQLVAAEGLANPSLERINDGQGKGSFLRRQTRIGVWKVDRYWQAVWSAGQA